MHSSYAHWTGCEDDDYRDADVKLLLVLFSIFSLYCCCTPFVSVWITQTYFSSIM